MGVRGDSGFLKGVSHGKRRYAPSTRAVRALREARKNEREIKRLTSELDLTKEIHAQLMPSKIPDIPGYAIYSGYFSARELGGDYYDFFGVDGEHLALVIADVAGKGIPASMVMAMTRTVLRIMATGNLSPADILSRTNYWVYRDIKRGMFVTVMLAILDVHKHQMKIASAGHNPLLLFRPAQGQVDRIRPGGIALGIEQGPLFSRNIAEVDVVLSPGDRVLLYTDGVVEAMDEERNEFGEERLAGLLRQHGSLSSKDFFRLLLRSLEEHQGHAEQHDDITLVTLRHVKG